MPAVGCQLSAVGCRLSAVGCRLYAVGHTPDDASTLVITERWSSREAHLVSLQDDVVRGLIGEARPLIGGMGDALDADAVGGLGVDGVVVRG